MISFRNLRADEIEIRAQRVKENGTQLLLYKNARCDMDILDETVGADNWQRKHYSEKNTLFCSVGIRNEDGQWIWKDDAGAESREEAEKGEASDSFKRACVNWGIGRELYTSPFIWVPANKINIGETVGSDGKPRYILKETFRVATIKYEKKRIVSLTINTCGKNNKQVFQFTDQKMRIIPEVPICKKCGKEIQGGTGQDGKQYTAQEVADKLGGVCKECFYSTTKEIADEWKWDGVC